MLVRRDAAGVRLFTRNGHDWTGRFPLIVTAAGALKARSCLIDGEAVSCDGDGMPCFDRFRYRRQDGHVFLYAFDLIELNGDDLRRERIERRKVLLFRLLAKASVGCRLTTTSLSRATWRFAMPVNSVSRASCRSGSARRMSPAARGTGSKARTHSTPQ
jgi:ATP-dependent DNA ligase